MMIDDEGWLLQTNPLLVYEMGMCTTKNNVPVHTCTHVHIHVNIITITIDVYM